MSAMLVQFGAACVAGPECPWYWTKADSDQDGRIRDGVGMDRSEPMLLVVMYHYVRGWGRNPFPALKSLDADLFRRQVDALRSRYEMATLESALALLRGEYRGRRPLCLLTFDDGVKDHYREVTPALVDRGIQGLFFLVTGCMEEQVVATVHKNHFLTAQLGLAEWQRRFVERAGRMGVALPAVDGEAAARTYPVGYAGGGGVQGSPAHFQLPAAAREPVVAELFAEEFGAEAAFARELYVSWEEARRMQMGGMVLGGHTHRHEALAAMPAAEMEAGPGGVPADSRFADAAAAADAVQLSVREAGLVYRGGGGAAAAARFLLRLQHGGGAEPGGADCHALQRVDCRQAA
jgi:peptidoglycan/xylan/chitin deacetylase (PgdA/CDA1 family)